MGVLGRAARPAVFFLRERLLELLAARLPGRPELVGIGLAERDGETAPADVSGQEALFFRRGAAVLALGRLQGLDGGYVVVELLNLATFAEAKILSYREIDSWEARRLRGRNRPYGFSSSFVTVGGGFAWYFLASSSSSSFSQSG